MAALNHRRFDIVYPMGGGALGWSADPEVSFHSPMDLFGRALDDDRPKRR
jgi:hypothetical protein